jgi:hypothetical protein
VFKVEIGLVSNRDVTLAKRRKRHYRITLLLQIEVNNIAKRGFAAPAITLSVCVIPFSLHTCMCARRAHAVAPCVCAEHALILNHKANILLHRPFSFYLHKLHGLRVTK